MRTIGSFLKNERLKNNLSLEDLSKITKIKKSFISSIESQRWHLLPEFPVVLGFVKNIASALDLDRDEAAALLKRDYPPKQLPLNPKPDIPREFRWSPRLTFLVGIALVVALVLGYLGIQYNKFIAPPELVVDQPKEGEYIDDSSLQVRGVTDPEATVVVNTQPAFVDDEGNFSTELELKDNVDTIEVVATSRSGKVTTIVRKIDTDI